MFLRNTKDSVVQASLAWVDHGASTMGAALAFYTVFSFAPILIIGTGVFGLFLSADTVRADLLPQLQNLLGSTGASALQELLASSSYMGKSKVATAIGVGTLLIGASTVFVELQACLDRVWGVPRDPTARGVWRFLRSRFLSLGLVFAVGFLLMVSLLLSTVLAAMGDSLAAYFGDWKQTIFSLDVLLSVLLSAGLFALLYKYVPQERMHWRDVWVGAVVTAILFNVGKFAIGFYLGRSAISSVYGAAGALLVLLLWTYYSAQIFLFGAEITRSYAFVVGSRAASQQPRAR